MEWGQVRSVEELEKIVAQLQEQLAKAGGGELMTKVHARACI